MFIKENQDKISKNDVKYYKFLENLLFLKWILPQLLIIVNSNSDDDLKNMDSFNKFVKFQITLASVKNINHKKSLFSFNLFFKKIVRNIFRGIFFTDERKKFNYLIENKK